VPLEHGAPVRPLLLVLRPGHGHSSGTSCSKHHARQSTNRRKDVVQRTVTRMRPRLRKQPDPGFRLYQGRDLCGRRPEWLRLQRHPDAGRHGKNRSRQHGNLPGRSPG
jgi:hypothetical protein